MFCWLACVTASFEIQLSMLIRGLSSLVYFSEQKMYFIYNINLVSAINQDMLVIFVSIN